MGLAGRVQATELRCLVIGDGVSRGRASHQKPGYGAMQGCMLHSPPGPAVQIQTMGHLPARSPHTAGDTRGCPQPVQAT